MQICKFFADSKSREQELSNDVSFVIFGHKTWDLEGGGQIDPPSISWFSSTPAGIGLILTHFQDLPKMRGHSLLLLQLSPALVTPFFKK